MDIITITPDTDTSSGLSINITGGDDLIIEEGVSITFSSFNSLNLLNGTEDDPTTASNFGTLSTQGSTAIVKLFGPFSEFVNNGVLSNLNSGGGSFAFNLIGLVPSLFDPDNVRSFKVVNNGIFQSQGAVIDTTKFAGLVNFTFENTSDVTGARDSFIFLNNNLLNLDFTNSGSIFGGQLQIDGTGTTDLTNSGTLDVTQFNFGAALGSFIDNTGTITVDSSVGNGEGRGGNADDRVENRGTLNANLRLFDGDDVVFNGDDAVINGSVNFGAGDDLFNGSFLSAITGTIFGGGGNDVIELGNSTATVVAGKGADSVEAKSGDDHISGNGGRDTIEAGDGLNTVTGGDGNDNITGGDDTDDVSGGRGNDVVNAGAGDDLINGNNGRDILSGEDGNDTVNGNDGDDRLRGDAGNDVIDGGRGQDEIFGGAGFDSINGGDGRDTINGGRDNDTIDGGIGADLIRGDSGNDVLRGGDGRDTLQGGAGDDFLIGMTDNETLTGGDGADAFAFLPPDLGGNTSTDFGDDVITDFTIGEDTIFLTFANQRNFDAIVAAGALSQDEDDTIIDFNVLGGSGSVRLQDITATDLQASDFDFGF